MRRTNALQRDPNLAKAFDNIASMFAPPSGSDFLASAKMQSERADAARLAEIYNYAKDPSFNRELFDRKLVAAGRATPNQSFYSVDQGNIVLKRGQDVRATTDLEQERIRGRNAVMLEQAKPVILGQDQTGFIPGSTQAAAGFRPMLQGKMEFDANKTYRMPDGTTGAGPYMPTSDQVVATVMQGQLDKGAVTPQAVVGSKLGTPLQTQGPNGPIYEAPGDAMARGARPADTDAPARADNFVAMGPDGKSFNFLGYARNGPNGLEIINQATGQPQPNVIRREGSQGGLSFESDGKGGIKLSTGNAAGQPTGRVNDLMRAESEGNRAVNELIPLLENLRQDDLGAAGNINDLMTNYGAQVAPGLARPDVTGRRNQLRATTLSLAKALLGDDRLSDADRRAAEAVSVSNGIDESLPGAQAKIASLIVLNAYRAAYAKSVRQGQQLPPLSPQIVGQMVDQKLIPLTVAEMYVRNNFTAREPTTGPVPGVQTPQLPGAAGVAAPPAQPGAPQQPVRVGTIEEARQLPSGTPIILPDGSPGRVP
jgi:hypothetical protein